MSLERELRVRVATRGADQVAGNVAFTFTIARGPDGFLADVGTYAGQGVEPTKGTADSLPWTVTVGEDQLDLGVGTEQFTRHIADADGRPVILNRLAEFSHRDFGSSDPWDVRATARLTTAREQGPGTWRLTFHDERIIERRTTAWDRAEASNPADLSGVDILHGADTTALFPMGATVPYAGYDVEVVGAAAGKQRLEYDVAAVNGNHVRLIDVSAAGRSIPAVGARLKMTDRVQEYIKDDLKPEVDLAAARDVADLATATAGHFDTLVANIEGTPRELLLGPTQLFRNVLIERDGTVGQTKENGRVEIGVLDVYWPTNQPSPGDRLKVFLYAPTAPASELLPKHIGAGGVHRVQLAKDLLEAAGERVNDAAFQELLDETYADVEFRITGPEQLSRWLEEKIWKPVAIAPLVDAEGRVAPKSMAAPTAVSLPDPTVLPVLDETKLREHPDWEHSFNDTVTELDYTWESYRNISLEQGRRPVADIDVPSDAAADLLEPAEKHLRRRHDRHDLVGPAKEEVSLVGIHSRDAAERAADFQSRQVFARLGDGPIRTPVKMDESGEDLPVGDFVRVEVPTYPNLATASRGGARILQLVQKEESIRGPDGELLDGGADAQPLPAPTVACTADGTELSVTISNVPASAGYVLRIAASASEPPDASDLWQPAGAGPGAETNVIGGLHPGTTYWVQARAVREGAISSVWGAGTSCTTGAADPITGAAVESQGTCEATVSWTAGDDELETEILVDGVLQMVLPPGDETVTLTDDNADLEAGTTPTVTIQHRSDGDSLPSTADTVQINLGSSPETGPDVLRAVVVVGEDIT